MAHPQQLEFLEILAKQMPRYFRDAKVLEIGSLNINGSIRQFFDRCDYIGIDVAEGRDVDLVCQGQEFDAPDDSFDHVVSCETMEHNPYWKETFANMIRLCRPGGLVTMACATYGRGEHGTSRSSSLDSPLTVNMGWEYYQNLAKKDFTRNFDFSSNFSRFGFWENWNSYDLYCAGIKRCSECTPETARQWEQLETAVYNATRHYNASLRSKLRKFLAATLGETGFTITRKLRRQF